MQTLLLKWHIVAYTKNGIMVAQLSAQSRFPNSCRLRFKRLLDNMLLLTVWWTWTAGLVGSSQLLQNVEQLSYLKLKHVSQILVVTAFTKVHELLAHISFTLFVVSCNVVFWLACEWSCRLAYTETSLFDLCNPSFTSVITATLFCWWIPLLLAQTCLITLCSMLISGGWNLKRLCEDLAKNLSVFCTVVIPPHTRSSGRRYLFFNRSFFLS